MQIDARAFGFAAIASIAAGLLSGLLPALRSARHDLLPALRDGVGASAGAADEVRVTVAWELTWYQWGVDLGDELRPVYELNKGFEVEEIDAPARQWNASATDGRIVLVAPRRREAANGKPVHR